MATTSLTEQAREIEERIGAILSRQDPDILSHSERKLWTELKQGVIDARLAVRDYEYAETRLDQQKQAKEARRFLEFIQSRILKSSESNMFGAVDVGQLTAQLEILQAALT